MSGLRIAVTGKRGQIVSSLIEQGSGRAEIIPIGRPTLDLSHRASVVDTLVALRSDIVVNAAAYTMVDRAEQDVEAAMIVNAGGAVAEAASRLDVPLIQISTDYVFDGDLCRPYREDDPTGPTGAYGCSKLEGEKRISELYDNYAILHMAWVYSHFGANFVRTMLRLGEVRQEVGVVADQYGNPTSALEIADGVLAVASRLAGDSSSLLRGVFHMSSVTEATWAEFAHEILEFSKKHGRPSVAVKRISTLDYPSPAKRPRNSRLDNSKIQEVYAVTLPAWQASLSVCVDRLLSQN